MANKVTIVTGGGSGIGQAIAIALADSGAKVQILDLNIESANETVSLVKKKGKLAVAHQCDISNQDQVNATIQKIIADSGAIQILVNSAGIANIGKLEDTAETDLDRIYQVNIKGVYHTMKASINSMRSTGGGVILNIASVAASVGIPDRFAYSMSKGAVLTMSLSVAKDYIKDNIRCNCISPARVHTPFVDGYLRATYPDKEKEMFQKLSATQPIGRMAAPSEIASLALFLCSDEASFITGSDYPIDGGFTRLNN